MQAEIVKNTVDLVVGLGVSWRGIKDPADGVPKGTRRFVPAGDSWGDAKGGLIRLPSAPTQLGW